MNSTSPSRMPGESSFCRERKKRPGFCMRPIGVDADQTAVGGADPGIAVAIDHRHGVAQRLADAGRRPDLLARGRVEAVQIAVAAVEAERVLRAEDHGTGGPRAGDVLPQQAGLPALLDQGHQPVLEVQEDAAAGIDGGGVADGRGLGLGGGLVGIGPHEALRPDGLGPLDRLGRRGSGRRRRCGRRRGSRWRFRRGGGGRRRAGGPAIFGADGLVGTAGGGAARRAGPAVPPAGPDGARRARRAGGWARPAGRRKTAGGRPVVWAARRAAQGRPHRAARPAAGPADAKAPGIAAKAAKPQAAEWRVAGGRPAMAGGRPAAAAEAVDTPAAGRLAAADSPWTGPARPADTIAGGNARPHRPAGRLRRGNTW